MGVIKPVTVEVRQFRKFPAVFSGPTIARNALASFWLFLQEGYCFLDSLEQPHVLSTFRASQFFEVRREFGVPADFKTTLSLSSWRSLGLSVNTQVIESPSMSILSDASK